MNKKTVALIFGGKSTEHEGSVESALHVMNNIDKNIYNVHALYIKKDGTFAKPQELINVLPEFFKNSMITIIPSLEVETAIFIELLENFSVFPEGSDKTQMIFFENLLQKKYYAVFPVFHGLFGEDGTVQGMLKFLNTPCIGCGINGSVLGIDKDLTKIICREKKISVTDYVSIKEFEKEFKLLEIGSLEEYLDYPMFVKPSRLGSSIGITRAMNREELINGINTAFRFDSKIIIEKGLIRPREFAVGVMGYGNKLKISAIGEFQSFKEDFFDFEAKYGSNSLDGVIPAKIDKVLEEKLKKMALDVYIALELEGFSRIDIFYDGKEIYLNEVNTIPGLESHGTFTKTWVEAGISRKDFLTLIIEGAVKNHIS